MNWDFKIWAVIGLVLIFGCFSHKGQSQTNMVLDGTNEITVQDFQEILQKSRIKGSILIYNTQANKLYSNDFKWAKTAKLPASTFKIPNSLIALETSIVQNDSSVLKWNGEKRELKIWEKDLTFKQAFHLSCVPCYQEIARKVGVKKMKEYTSKFQYGNLHISKDNLDKFWLEGKSTISQYQQIEFLKAFYENKLPISKRTSDIMKRIMVMDTINNYVLSGKTGWSVRNGNNNGWFVGYLKKPNNNLFFAVNIEPKNGVDTKQFLKARKLVLLDAIKILEQKRITSTNK